MMCLIHTRSVALLKLVCIPQSSRLFSLSPCSGATAPLLGLPQFCSAEWKQRDANRLLALRGQAGPTSGMLASNDLESGEGIHLQQFFPGA